MSSSPSISKFEMFALQIMYVGASAGSIYPSYILRSTQGAFWVPIAVWTAGAVVSSWLYGRLLSGLDGEKLLVRLREAIGIVGTCLLSAPLLLFLLLALIVMLRAYTEMVTMTMLPSTPISFLNGIMLAPAALALAGTMPIARAARVFFILTILLSAGLLLVGFSDVSRSLGAPWLRTNGDFLADKQFYSGSFIWMGFVITSMIGPYTKRTARRGWQGYMLALCCALPLILAYIYLPVLTFGRELGQRLTFPFISKMDSVSHYWIVFENLTAIFVSITMLYVLLIMALKMHAAGEMILAVAPRMQARFVYAGIVIAVYTVATALVSWRAMEDMIAFSAVLRLYVMFAFPLLGMAALLYGRQRAGKEGGR